MPVDRNDLEEPVPVNQPSFSGREREYVLECMESGWISSEGPFVGRFEQAFAQAVGRRHGIAVANGTVALEVAVRALGLGPGDEVIMPAFTIVSPAMAVVQAGARPVLVDSDPRTWNMNLADIESKITPRTRVILVVHIYGLPVDMEPVLALAAKHGLRVIEDAAEMHGQTCRGRPCGSFGDVSVFSFYANKLVTTGEGGMVVVDDDRLEARCRSLRNLCFGSGDTRFVHEELGGNHRMTSLQAALGLAQLERIDAALARKRAIGALYNRLLGDQALLELSLPRTAYAESCYWVYGLVLADDAPVERAALMTALAERGIGTRPFFWPMHEQPAFQRMGLFTSESHPVASRLGRRGFYLPSGTGLRDDQVVRAAEALRDVLRESVTAGR